MARFYAAIANGGNLVTPYIVSSVEQPSNDGTPPVALKALPGEAAASDQGRPAGALRRPRRPLPGYARRGRHVVRGLRQLPGPVAGKTGTAEKVVPLPGYPFDHQEDQAWWCGWGPTDDAELVVCAVIENGGHGGAVAAPAALKLFEYWFQEKAGVQGVVTE